MVYCRGCAKEIHETAQMCPHCGYVVTALNLGSGQKNYWMAIVSLVISALSVLNWLTINQWDGSERIGLITFSVASIALSTISLSNKYRGRIMNYWCLGISVITLLAVFGSME